MNDMHADLNDLLQAGALSGEKDPLAEARAMDPPGWPPPTPFHQWSLPTFPVDALPEWQADFVRGLAEETQTPPDLAGMLVLATTAVAVAGRFRINPRSSWHEPLCLWTLTSMRPGNRKTEVFSQVTRPLLDWELAEVARMQPEIDEAQSRRRVAEKALQRAEELAAKAEGDEDQRAAAERIEECRRKLAEAKVPAVPRLVVDDATPERIASMISEQGGRLGILSAEGDVFELMAGRYSSNQSSNLGVYLKGHAGDALRVDRVGRASEFVERPALTLGLAVQPDVLEGLIQKPGFGGRGLLGRFLYSVPQSLLGRRRVSPSAMSAAVRETYRRNILSLLALPGAVAENGEPTAHVLALSVQASAGLIALAEEIEPQLAEFGELGAMTDWGGKVVGAVARIAGILHLARHAGERRSWEEAVPLSTLECAVEIGRYCIPHARAAYADMGADPVVAKARTVLAWLGRTGSRRVSRRDVFNGMRGRFKKIEDLDPALACLVDHGYLRPVEIAKKAGPGRPPSPEFDVHPRWSTHIPQNAQNPDRQAHSADIAGSAMEVSP